MAKKRSIPSRFPGYTSPNYTPVPDTLFDEQLPDLTGAELKVLLYVCRRTFGFKREADNISLSQLLTGLRTRDGRVLDRGTGLTKKTLLGAIKSLEEKNILITERRRSMEKGDEPTSYRLNVRQDGTTRSPDHGQEKTTPPVGEKIHQGGGGEIPPEGWGRNSPTQETDGKTDSKTFEIRKGSPDFLGQDGERTQPAASLPNAVSRPAEASAAQGPGHSAAPGDAVPAGEPSHRPPSDGYERFRDQARTQRAALRQETSNPNHRGGGEEPHASPPGRMDEGTRTGMEPVAALLPVRRGRPRGSGNERELITAYLADWAAAELGDEAPLSSSVTRALRIFKAADVPTARWPDLLYQARAITKEYSAQITKKPTTPGRGFAAKNRMPFYLAVLADLAAPTAHQDDPAAPKRTASANEDKSPSGRQSPAPARRRGRTEAGR